MEDKSDAEDSEELYDDGGGWESDFDMQHSTDATLFSGRDRIDFNRLLKDVVLPSGIDPVPANLGDAQHGKLKAAQWKTIFVYIIPLVIPELLVLDVEELQKIIKTFFDHGEYREVVSMYSNLTRKKEH